LPSSLTGYDHDVFLSFASFDDRGGGEGWVQVLAAELLHSLGHGVDIDATGGQVSRPAVLVVLLSGRYLNQVGSRDLEAFAADGARRLIPVLLQEPPPGEAWPPACVDASPVIFYGTDDVKHGRRHDSGTEAYEEALSVLAGRIADVLRELQPEEPTAGPELTADFTVFLATTSDDLTRNARRLRRELERGGVHVLGEVPPSLKADDHEVKVRDALGKADLAVYLFGPNPGESVADKPKCSYPVEQFRLGRQHASPQLVLFAETLRDLLSMAEDVGTVAYQNFLIELEESKRDDRQLAVVRVGRQRMAQTVMTRLRIVKPPPSAPPKPATAARLAASPAVSPPSAEDSRQQVKDASIGNQYDVFVSYNTKDKTAALGLCKGLRTRGLRPWIDVWDSVPGKPRQPQLERIIEDTPCVVVLVGASGLGPWASMEMGAALEQLVERKASVIPVLLKDAPSGAPELPLFLRGIVWVDLREEGFERLVGGIKAACRQGQVPDDSEQGLRDQEAGHFSSRLEELYAGREQLVIDGEDTHTLDYKILDLRRQQRKGPQLHPDEYLLDGRFRLVETLGQGGFGTVWKAYDRQRKGLVAVKVLLGEHSGDRSRRERFFRGSRKMAELTHPNIVRVLEEKLADDGWLFFVMELVVGDDFGRAVLDGKVPEDSKLAIVCQVGEVLEFAHQRGVVHRDVKPANILLDEDLQPKLTDFDLMRAEGSIGFTQTQAMLGTLPYAAPETLEMPKDAGPPADVYSLASTMVFALLGKSLPRGYYRDPAPAIEDLGCAPTLARVLSKATASDPEKRYASAGAFVKAVKEAVTPPSGLADSRSR
jgi:hypothetical protein